MKKISILILISILLFTCEKDDICADTTPTTPRVYIEFYKTNTPDQLKNVSKLYVIGEGKDAPLEEYNGTSTKNKIFLPLKTNTTQTKYILHKNYAINDNETPDNPDDDYITGNPDTIVINYAPEVVYVSRACGYKTIFTNLTIVVENDDDNWIDYEIPATDNEPVTNEEHAHYYLYD